MITYLWVALGSALGGMARYWLSGLVAVTVGETFPWGTLAVNILGSFVIGFFAAFASPNGRFLIAPDMRILVMVGICGGFTTFSSFSLQTLNLVREGDILRAGMNILLSVTLCLLAVWIGHTAAGLINHVKTL